jgi:hypothetical protein
VTLHKSPALVLFILAGIKAYGFGWALGADTLLIVSVGTGSFRNKRPGRERNRMPSAAWAVRTLTGLIGNTPPLPWKRRARAAA